MQVNIMVEPIMWQNTRWRSLEDQRLQSKG